MSQPINQAQLFFVMPVSRYMQVMRPIIGISEYFLNRVTTDNTRALNQNMMSVILGVAKSMKLSFPAA